MANEATIIYETSIPIPFTCADNTGIEKGTLLQVTDLMTVSASSAQGQDFIGVASEEKIANDGKTMIGVWTSGIFKMTDSGAGVAVGDMLKLGGANTVATADEAGAQCAPEYVGIALETAAAGNTLLVAVRKI